MAPATTLMGRYRHNGKVVIAVHRQRISPFFSEELSFCIGSLFFFFPDVSHLGGYFPSNLKREIRKPPSSSLSATETNRSV
ncbi:hypothetical protein CEXT_567231 [Caerostris extrusa]|uniref:Ycf15 n=1 Tax=Caerostris extrusa TaxID=172846 RepID=A0AAV4UMJ4_CAEEX|nr:hypothetical protein CEXT_567231 [Caerostris extrusa]